jgi:glycosyltransferase involved in cell wall biosynthesis
VPAYNEADRIAPSLRSILAFATRFGRPVEILVVDDGSDDGTGGIAGKLIESGGLDGGCSGRVIVNEGNRGKGFSVRRGVLAARGELVLVSDADLSTPIEEVGVLLDRIGRSRRGLVIGSRALRDSRVEVHQSLVREIMGKTFNVIVRIVTGLPFHDTQCGFKLMVREDVTPILARARIDGFSYDVELLYVAVRSGLPVEEVAVTWRNAPGSKVGILTDPLRMLRDILRVRRWYRRGHYGGPGSGRGGEGAGR